MLFLQDNAPIHTAGTTIQWFNTRGVQLLRIPSCSPDINCVEHLWPHLKVQLYKIGPDIEQLQGRERILRAMEEALPIAWAAIEDSVFQGC